jgi:2-amino-4-hydroxy-6-hydroxymethyldihydropteridine diphosphokinase
VSGTRQRYLLGLGSNLGDRPGHLTEAIRLLGDLPKAEVTAISPAFDSDPIGFSDQPNFLNLCLEMVCELEPAELLKQTLAIESHLGRLRTSNRNGPRTLDIDLLFWEGGAIRTEELTLPHPRWKERGFVTVPLRHLLQSPGLASVPCWDWLRRAVPLAPGGEQGLRAWHGSTPWHPTPG